MTAICLFPTGLFLLSLYMCMLLWKSSFSCIHYFNQVINILSIQLIIHISLPVFYLFMDLNYLRLFAEMDVLFGKKEYEKCEPVSVFSSHHSNNYFCVFYRFYPSWLNSMLIYPTNRRNLTFICSRKESWYTLACESTNVSITFFQSIDWFLTIV